MFRSKVQEALWNILAGLMMFRFLKVPGGSLLTLGEDFRELFKHELHYLALEHHVDRHIG